MLLGVFEARDFRLFYAGQAASYLGDGLRTLAIPLLVFKLTGSAFNLGASYGIEFFAFGLFSVIGGSLADRLNRRRLMIVCDAVRCAILILFIAGYLLGELNVSTIYVGLFVHAACGAIFNNGQASSIPYILGKDRATSAVALLEGTFQSCNIIAPPIGAALFGLVGPVPALEINALTYAVSMLSLALVRDLGPERTSRLPNPGDLLADVKYGFRFVVSDQAFRIMSLTSFAANGVVMIGYTVLVPFVERDLGGSHFGVGLLFGSSGFGAAMGALLATYVQRPFGRIIIASYVIDAAGWVALAFTSSLWVTCLALAVAACSGAFGVANLLGWRMRLIPEGSVGRVFGAARLLVMAGTPFGAILGGALAEHFGARLAIGVSAALFFIISLSLLGSPTMRAERR
jgi:MFS family permease